jgi:peptidoglycan/LPS O-acetylase OafA/YrhL
VEWHIYFLFALVLLPVWKKIKQWTNARTALVALLVLGMGLGFGPLLLLPNSANLSWASVNFIAVFTLGMASAILLRSTDTVLAHIRGFVA